MIRWSLISVIAVLLVALCGALLIEYNNPIAADAKAVYIGGSSCITCHQQQHEHFQNSHHDLAMDIATDTTVLAEFDGSKIEHFGITSTVFKRGDRFMVNTEGPDGNMQDFEVKMVFGYKPLQQYMVELNSPGKPNTHGQYQVLRLSWNVEKREWFYLTPPDVKEKLAPDDPLHWTGISQRWNTNCATCHSTNLQKNFDTLTAKYSTTFTDIDVNCESCHGPGSLHVEIASRRRFFWDKNHGLGLANNLKTTDNQPQIETCAPCHSRRAEFCSGHQAGKNFNDFFSCQLLTEPIYHADGQIRDEDYVYGSFIQSKMFHKGIKCTDCHDPHSVKVKFNDNRLCTSCHQHPAGKYDSPSHHRHKTGSSGSLCVECHMPATTYMAIDARRDHSLRVPRPDLTVKFGTPNACSACHLDKNVLPEAERNNLTQYLDWINEANSSNKVIANELNRVNQLMAKSFSEWYPEAAKDNKRSKYYEMLSLGNSDRPESLDALEKLATDRNAPSLFRASAIEVFRSKGSLFDIDFLVETVQDEDPKVVAAALMAIDQQLAILLSDSSLTTAQAIGKTVRKYVKLVNPLFRHPSRLVRVTAARVTSNLPPGVRINAQIATREYRDALEEYTESLRIGSDIAASHLVLGNMYMVDNKLEQAEDAFRTAIRVEPEFAGPRASLAALLGQRVDSLRTQIIRTPKSDNNVAIGQRIDRLEAEISRLRVEENNLLRKDVERAEGLVDAHELFYKYGLSCYLMRDLDTAEKYLLKAYDLRPNNENYTLAAATFYIEVEKFQQAMRYINQLIKLRPDNRGYQQLRDKALRKSK